MATESPHPAGQVARVDGAGILQRRGSTEDQRGRCEIKGYGDNLKTIVPTTMPPTTLPPIRVGRRAKIAVIGKTSRVLGIERHPAHGFNLS